MKYRCAAFILTFILICSVLKFKASTDAEGETKADLTVIMYHSFLKDSSKSGPYIITPSQFENDIIYLKNAGFSFVSVKDIENYKNSKGSLPEKSVLITMDDGNYNNYCYIYPILKKYQIPALISPIAYWVEKYTQTGEVNPIYSIITTDCIKEMYNSGYVEFGNHTYNLHSDKGRMGTRKLNGETSESYKAMLTEDLTKAHNIILGATGSPPCALVYPYGIICPDSYEVAKNMGYDILFSCTEGINYIAPSDDLYVLKRYNRPAGLSSENFFTKIYR